MKFELLKRTAIEIVPSCKELIENSRDVGSIWLSLSNEFEKAYEEPTNRILISNIYKFAYFCLMYFYDAEIEVDAMFCFYEKLPLNEKMRNDISNHLSKEEFILLKNIFANKLSKEDYERFLDDMMAQYCVMRRELERL